MLQIGGRGGQPFLRKGFSRLQKSAFEPCPEGAQAVRQALVLRAGYAGDGHVAEFRAAVQIDVKRYVDHAESNISLQPGFDGGQEVTRAMKEVEQARFSFVHFFVRKRFLPGIVGGWQPPGVGKFLFRLGEIENAQMEDRLQDEDYM